jgi:hypothetical protein
MIQRGPRLGGSLVQMRDTLIRATRPGEGFATFKSLALPSRGKSPVLPPHPAQSVPSAE